MTSFTIDADIGAARFPINLGVDILDELGERWADRALGRNAMIVADENLADHARRAGDSLSAAGFAVHHSIVPPGEGSKTLAQLESLARFAARVGLKRADAIVAVGGGVVGDLAGFLAATYQRGIRLVHVPTTLLAMVDSAIGGKTGVDLPEGKNYVGAIWQPEMVLMDAAVLRTLPARELSCGFAEVIKYGLLDGPDLFEHVAGWPALPGPDGPLLDLIRRCVEHKLAVVAADERDLGVRASLNLGHTVGHGIETAAGYDRYRHGEAISLGLLAALRIAEQSCGLDPVWRERTRQVIAAHHLPVRLADEVATDDILAAMNRDKKASASGLNMVAINAPGKLRLNVNPSREAVIAAIEELRR